MPDEPESILLVYIRRLDAKLDRVIDDVGDLERRMTLVEAPVGQMVASEQLHYAALAGRIDRLEDRLNRIEHRLDLVPG